MDYSEIQKKPNSANLAWQIKLFVLSMLVPTEMGFSVGSFRLSASRVILILFFVPCFFKLFNGQLGKVVLVDKLFVFYGGWIILAISVHHGLSVGLESGGILLIESLGAYLLGRCYLTGRDSYRAFVNFMFLVLVVLSFVTVLEALTGFNLIRPGVNHIGRRLGLLRAFGPFDHAILYGVFCGSLFSLVLYISSSAEKSGVLSKKKALWCVVATFASVSSGALVAIVIQIFLAIWDHCTRKIYGRWKMLGIALIFTYFLVDLISNRSPMRVFLHRLTFSAHTAYNRLTIWEWGTKYNVAEHPVLGIGFNEWVRPSWMHSTSMDNFWLVNMVRYGLPSFFFLAAGIVFVFYVIGKKKDFDDDLTYMKRGYFFSLIGVMVAGCTVHFWNSLYVWFFFLLSSGVWMTVVDVKR